MSRSPILVSWALVLTLACAGCGTIPTRQLIAGVVPLRESLLTACPSPPSDPVEDRIEAVKARLHQHPVVTFVLDAIRIGVTPQQSRADQIRKLHDLNANTLKNFGERIHERFFSHDLDREGMRADLASTKAHVEEFNQVLVAYVSAYVDGKYVDRFGNTLPTPAISRTVGNTEIAGVLSVMIDAVADYVVRSPVWTDPTGKIYYPAAFNAAAPDLTKDPKAMPLKPTVVDIKVKTRDQGGDDGTPLIKPLPLVASGCGIDEAKAQAIEYLGQTAALKASMVGGISGGSFGGFGVSFGAFGKVSVGDNQTVQVVIKTVLAKVAERVAADAAYRLLYKVPDKAKLAELVKRYLDEVHPAGGGSQ
jgi:hypothetical protein